MDIIDLANKHADLFRENALRTAEASRRWQPVEAPLIIDGIRCCLDCEDPIPEGRLLIRPEAVRCVECQGRYERKGA